MRPRSRGLSPLLTLLAALRATAFVFTVAPGASECFDEHANASDHVQGTWSATAEGGGLAGPDDLNGWKVVVTSSSGDMVYTAEAKQQGSFDYYATVEGTYVVCFSRAAHESEAHHGSAVLQVSAKIRVGDPPDLIQLAKTEHLSPIEERIKSLHEAMNSVRDLQDQMREQDEAQSKMTRSTRSWLIYFTLIEAMVLVGVTVWQNLYLKSFFEVKRVV